MGRQAPQEKSTCFVQFLLENVPCLRFLSQTLIQKLARLQMTVSLEFLRLVACLKVSRSYQAKWQEKHQSFRIKHGLPDEMWSATRELRGIRTDREKDVIDLCWQYQRKLFPECLPQKLHQNLLVDVSQSGDRTPWCYGARSLVKASRIYSFDKDRTLQPAELFALLGSPLREHKPELTRVLKPNELHALAGDAFAAPCVALAAISAILAVKGF
eukprot:5693616-Amphidinium_carterae.3